MELTNTFIKRYKTQKEFSHETIDCLLQYHWPGNVRELSNIMERLILTVDDQTILPEHLPEQIDSNYLSVSLHALGRKPLPEIMKETEMRVLGEALERCNSTTAMAKYLGVTQPTVVRKLQKYKSVFGETPTRYSREKCNHFSPTFMDHSYDMFPSHSMISLLYKTFMRHIFLAFYQMLVV
ncbi:regulatory protein, Fis family [Alteribacillus iranensis]|uniref:Regulatory protein, Fis family n=2 Tax=Alteribacillus iranensis TaxID=930128 RepID=A0A1I2B699_9BACI|nr:regulatory protein, Fis family [Alteribacillus iranensis]